MPSQLVLSFGTKRFSTKLCEPCSAFSLVLLTPASYGIRIRNGMAKFFNPVPYLKLYLKGVLGCSIKGY